MIRQFLALLVLVAIVPFAQAQNNASTYAARLRMPDAVNGAQVTVSNDADVAAGLTTSATRSVAGYRICIFFDNTQNGRNLANGALGRFRGQFSDIPSGVIYVSPTFKTMVGYCIDKTEAAMMLGRVVDIFPDAFMVREENMPISKLTHYSSLTATPSDSLSVTDTGFNF